MGKSSCCETGGMGGHGKHGAHGGHGQECCCHSGRHFITRAEQLAHLEKYKEQVELELQGIQEHIDMLKHAG
jgi:hypothetical protein